MPGMPSKTTLRAQVDRQEGSTLPRGRGRAWEDAWIFVVDALPDIDDEPKGRSD